MAMTPERIAEIEDWTPGKFMPPPMSDTERIEICRLARLGLRVESAPTTRAKLTPQRWAGPTWLQYEPLPNEWGGKRVALVVLEDSE